MRKILLLSACACFVLAQEFELGVVEVVANKGGAKSTDANIATIYADDLSKNEIKRVSDIAKNTAGVFVEKKGGRAEQNIIVRGFDSRRVPIFIDGIPVYIPYDGNMDLGRFSTFDLSRIDISKGSSSVLYGSNTMGGAINLVTKKPSRELEGEVGYGLKFGKNSGTFGNDVHFNLGTNQGLFYIQTGGSYLTNNANQLSSSYKQSEWSKEDGNAQDHSKTKDKKFSIKFGITPNETDEYVIAFSTQKASKEQPFYAGKYEPSYSRRGGHLYKFWDWSRWDKDSVYFLSNTQFEKFYVKTKAFYDTFKNDLSTYDNEKLNTQNSGFNSHYKDHSYGFGVELGGDIGDKNSLKFSTNYKYDTHKEHDDGEPEQSYKDKIYSFGLENTFKFSELTKLIFGVSYDTKKGIKAQDYQNNAMYEFDVSTEHAFNYQAQLKHSFDGTDEFGVSYAKKTYFPSMKERYTRSLNKNKEPNPFLKPEVANHYELSYAKNYADNLRIESAIFYSTIKDAVGEVLLANKNYQNQNIGKARYVGFEFGANYALNETFNFGANYTYINAKYKNSDEKIYNLPKHKGFIYTDIYFTPNLSLYLSQELSSSRYSSVSGRYVSDAKISGFGVTNLKLSYKTAKNIELSAGISNLFDKNYEYQEGYPEDGRTFFANVNYKF